MTDEPVVETFARLAERAGCTVRRVGNAALAAPGWWRQTLGGNEPALDVTTAARNQEMPPVAVAPSLLDAFPPAGQALLAGGAIRSGEGAQLLRCTIGVSAAALAIAETGSLLLTGAEPADRLAWLLPARAVVLIRETDVHRSLDDAMAWLAKHRDAGAATLVTGPSRTSDVERVLTIGVQGPREVVVVLVADGEG